MLPVLLLPCRPSRHHYIVMNYIVMAYIVMAYIVIVFVDTAYIVMTYIAMACIVMAYIVMAYIVMADIHGLYSIGPGGLAVGHGLGLQSNAGSDSWLRVFAQCNDCRIDKTARHVRRHVYGHARGHGCRHVYSHGHGTVLGQPFLLQNYIYAEVAYIYSYDLYIRQYNRYSSHVGTAYTYLWHIDSYGLYVLMAYICALHNIVMARLLLQK